MAEFKALVDRLDTLNTKVTTMSEEVELARFQVEYSGKDIVAAIKDLGEAIIGSVNPAKVEEENNDKAKRDEEILRAIKEGNKEKKDKDEKPKDEESSWLKTIIMSLGATLGFAVGMLEGYVKLLTQIFPKTAKAIRDTIIGIELNLQLFKKSVVDFVARIKGVFTTAGEAVSKLFKGIIAENSLFKTIAEMFGKISSMGAEAKKAFSLFSGVGEFLVKLGKFGESISKMSGWFGKAFSIFKTLGSELLAPIFAMVAIFHGITDAINEFKQSGSIIKSIEAGLAGIVKSLWSNIIGGAADLVKDLVSWIAEKLGFKELSKWLDSFSIDDIGRDLIDIVMQPIKTIEKVIDMLGGISIPAFEIPNPFGENWKVGPFEIGKKEKTPVSGGETKNETKGTEQPIAQQIDLPNEVTSANTKADLKAAAEWKNANPETRKKIEEVTGMSAEQLQTLSTQSQFQDSNGQTISGPVTMDSSGKLVPVRVTTAPAKSADVITQSSDANAEMKDLGTVKGGTAVVSAPITNNNVSNTTVQTKGPVRTTEPSANRLLSNIYA